MNDFLKKLKDDNKITSFFYKKLSNQIVGLDDNSVNTIIKEAIFMSDIGIDSDDDFKSFFYIYSHIPSIIGNITDLSNINNENIAKISYIVYKNKDLYPIDTIYNLYKAAANALNVLNVPLLKFAYPQNDVYIGSDNLYNIDKWMQSMREIYANVHRGYTFKESLKKVTSNWDIMETKKFESWMKFYQEGAHNKYKTAQDYYTDDNGAPMVPIKDFQNLRGFIPGMPDMSQYDKNEDKKGDKKEDDDVNVKIDLKIETAKKLRSRLNSAETLATSDGAYDLFGGPEGVQNFLSSLHTLKRMIVNNPKRSFFIKDLIIREGNILSNNGYNEAGIYMIKLAQEQPATSAPDKSTPPPAQAPAAPAQAPAAQAPAAPAAPPPAPAAPDSAPPDSADPFASTPDPASLDTILEPTSPTTDVTSETKDPIDEFIDLMNTDDSNTDNSYTDDTAFITVTAQPDMEFTPSDIAPNRPLVPKTPLAPKQPPVPKSVLHDKPLIEITDEDEESESEFDLSKVTTEDVVAKLELVSSILKNREIPRQLSMIDLMMDKLGVAAFFPTLGEATRSALESNQYMSTRIEDILSKLRGSIELPDDEKIDLVPEQESPVEDIKENLEEEQDKEEKLKEIRRQKREDKDLGVETSPDVTVTSPAEELAGPVKVERPVRPTPPTPPPVTPSAKPIPPLPRPIV